MALVMSDYIWLNSNQSVHDVTNKTADTRANESLQYPAALFAIFIALTLFGNILVVLAVKRDRNLHTVTNYLIVSLAVADLTVGSLVMPFAVYVEMMGGQFLLHRTVCDLWVALDVMACTSSIVNMTAISIDRYLAVFFPHFYNQNKTSTRYRVAMISLCWIVSIGTCLPIALGANKTDSQTEGICTFFNPYYSVISSCVSFVIPTIVMLILYYKILRMLHKRANTRAKASKSRLKPNNFPKEQNSDNSVKSDEFCNSSSDPPSFRESSSVATRQPVVDTFNSKLIRSNNEVYNKSTCTADEKGCLISNCTTSSPYSTSPTITNENNNELSSGKNAEETFLTTAKVELENGTNRKISRLNSVVQVAQNRLKTDRNTTKERRAIIMLMVVLCVFLCCWLPFFITNNQQVICKYLEKDGPSCTVPDKLMSFFIWIGYINSMLNPLIYAIFNAEYRAGFKKLLRCLK